VEEFDWPLLIVKDDDDRPKSLNTGSCSTMIVEHGSVFNEISHDCIAKNQGVWGKRLIAIITIFFPLQQVTRYNYLLRAFHTIESLKEVLGGKRFFIIFIIIFSPRTNPTWSSTLCNLRTTVQMRNRC